MRQMIIAATAVLMLAGAPAALAQKTDRNGANTGTNPAPAIAAPVGHRQPRVGDVPSETGVTKLDAEDAALDRKIKSICRGC
jgi:hypothetical protein